MSSDQRKTRRLTVAQAIVTYLEVQLSEYDGVRQRLVPAMFGIFGHGNVAGMGQALDEYGHDLPYLQGRNEQSMVHAAAAFAKTHRRIPRVRTIHNSQYWHARPRLGIWCERRLVPAHIVGVSQAALAAYEQLSHRVGTQPFTAEIIYNGIDFAGVRSTARRSPRS